MKRKNLRFIYVDSINNKEKRNIKIVIKLQKKKALLLSFYDINQSVKLKKVFRPCLWT
jgi:hypothetical protein